MLAIYIIATLLVLVFLVGAYRMMGAGATTDEDPRDVLEAVANGASEAIAALKGTSDGAGAEPARAVRRRLDGCAQALERIAATPVDATLDAARTALELAVDELTWSARLAETPGYARDPALTDAGAALRASAGDNLARAQELIGTSARP